MRVWPGRPYPLGATWDGAGVNFASSRRTRRRLSFACSMIRKPPRSRCGSRSASRPTRCGTITSQISFRASSTGIASTGRTNPRTAIASTRNKVLLDPYAKAIGRDLQLGRLALRLSSRITPRTISRSTSATACSVRPAGRRRRHRVHLGRRSSAADTLAQDIHLRSCTSRASPSGIPDVPEKLRGTYAGLASEAAIQHLLDLGVTAVELLPVHHHVDDRHPGRTRDW